MKNEGRNHGLFGKLDTGNMTHFEDYKSIAKLVYANTKQGITIYRAVIAPSEEAIKDFHLTNQNRWKEYIEEHIQTIATGNGISRLDLAFVCAAHNENGKQHIHIAFWDKSQKDRVKNPYVLPKVPNDIRKLLIKDTFKEKILEFAKTKDATVTLLREITTAFVDDFDKETRSMSKKKYLSFQNPDIYNEPDMYFSSDFMEHIASKVFEIKSRLPSKGRIAYQLLPIELKTEVDKVVKFVVDHQSDIKALKNEYIESKMKMVHLYGGSDEYFKRQSVKYSGEADKIIANGLLGMIKTINRFESEGKSKAYIKSRQEQLVSQMLYALADVLNNSNYHINMDFDTLKIDVDELSKEAKKELYLKLQDKGYEH